MAPLETSRYLAALRADAARIADLLPATVDLPVPGCPGWVVADVVRHVGTVYRHKAASVRLGRRAPDEAPPSSPASAAELVPELAAALEDVLAVIDRDPSIPAWSWCEGNQSIGFWQRRMAQETLMHRVDVEQAGGLAPVIDEDLAIDGVDEVLTVFLPRWLPVDGPAAGVPEELAAHLAVGTGGRMWNVRVTGRSAVAVEGRGDAATLLEGPADAVLLWCWGRASVDGLTVSGNPADVAGVRRALVGATQ